MTGSLATMAEFNKSIEDAIYKEAKKKGIEREKIIKYFDFVMEDQLQSVAIAPPQWRLARAGYLVWEHFFPGTPYPSPKQKEKSEVALRVAREADKLRSGGNSGKASSWAAGNMDFGWLHDKYDPNPLPPRLLESKPARGIDSYVPRHNVRSPETVSSSREDSDRSSNRALVPIGNTYRPTERAPTPAKDSRRAYDRTENTHRHGRSRSRGDRRADRNRSQSVDRNRSRHRRERSRSRSPPRGPRDTDQYRYKSQLKELKEMLLAAGENISDIVAQYGQKKRVAENRYAEQGSSWQQWYSESVIWQSHFIVPFPGKEPRMKRKVAIRKGEDGEYTTIEQYMEAKAVSRNERRQFFIYVQQMRDKAKDEHPGCSHTTRAYVADFLTWERFWPNESFPTEPAIGHSLNCTLKTKTAQVLKEVSARSSTAAAQAQQNNMPTMQPILPTTSIQPGQLPFGAIPLNNLQFGSLQRGFPLIQQAGMQGILQYSPYVAVQPSPFMNSFAAVPTQSSLAADLAAIEAFEQPNINLEAAPPASVVNILLRLQSQQGAGKIIIVNEHQIPCQRATLVAMTYNAIKAEAPMVFVRISASLRCFMHFHRVASGDLLLWAYPRYARDEPASKVGQKFFHKWVEKNLAGVHVRPSEYWREFEATPHWMEFRWGKVLPTWSTSALDSRTSPLASTPPTVATNKITLGIPAARERSTVQEKENGVGEQSTPKEINKPATSIQEKLNMLVQSSPDVVISKPSDRVNKALGWGEYEEKFKPSDIDMLLMEEEAKAEGLLRMVLDEETGEVVALKVLLSRTARRSTGRDGVRRGLGGASAETDRESGQLTFAFRAGQPVLLPHSDSSKRSKLQLDYGKPTFSPSQASAGGSDRKIRHGGDYDLSSSQLSRTSSGRLRDYREISGRAIAVKCEDEEEEGEVRE